MSESIFQLRRKRAILAEPGQAAWDEADMIEAGLDHALHGTDSDEEGLRRSDFSGSDMKEAAFAEWKAREAAEAAEMEVAALERVLNEAIRRSAENLEADK